MKPSLRASLALVVTVLCAASVSAQPIPLNLNATPPGENSMANPVVVPIVAGTYDITYLSMATGGVYDAWNAWGFVAGCDASGANCSNGWITPFTCNVPGVGEVAFDLAAMRWETPDLANANAPMDLSFSAAEGNLECWIPDNNVADNMGGLSFQIERRLTSVEVPTLGHFGLALIALLLGLAGVRALRR